MAAFQLTPSLGPPIRRVLIAGVAMAVIACTVDTSLERLAQARQVAADLHLSFSQAVDASNRSLSAGADGTAAEVAREAEQASQAVQRSADALTPLLEQLRYADESRLLEQFRGRFAEYLVLDQRIFRLAVAANRQRTQRLSADGRTAADTLDAALVLSLNLKAQLAAKCSESLRALGDALATRGFAGTR